MGKKKIITKGGDQTEGKEAVSETKAPSRKVDSGRVYVAASFNNTIVTVTDAKGNCLAWASAGSMGFSGPKKATPFAASKVVAALTEKLKKTGLQNVDIVVSGVGGGRDSAVRSFINQGFNVTSIRDVTPIPHNGPKPRKVRRV